MGAHDAQAGLTTAEAQRRLGEFGPNRVADQAEQPLWRLARPSAAGSDRASLRPD